MSGLSLAIYGSGRLATEALRQLPGSDHRVVAAVVHSAAKAGRDLGELTTGEALGVTTTADLDAGLAAEVDLMLYTGLIGETQELVMQRCAEAGIDLIHTCFVHPGVGLEPAARERLSAAAEASGARILGTGIVPGLLTDVLPALLATGLPDPVSVEARLVSDLSSWGEEVLRKELGVGTGQTGAAWRYDAIMRESAFELAEALAIDLDELASEGGLLAAKEPVEVGPIAVARGEVEGFEQRVIGRATGVVRLDLTWLALPGPRQRDLEAGLGLALQGGEGSHTRLRLTRSSDPYPGTAARMLKAIGPLRRMPPGIHLPAALSITP